MNIPAEAGGGSLPDEHPASARPAGTAVAGTVGRSSGWDRALRLMPAPLWVLLLVLLLTVAGSVTVRTLVSQQQQARFEREVTAYQQNLKQRFQGYVGVLLAVRASWEAVAAVRSDVQGAASSGSVGPLLSVSTPALSSQQFGRLVAGLELNVRYPGLSSLGYAPLVTAPGRAAFARQLPSIAGDPAAGLHPTSMLALSAPVTYLAPPSGDRSVLGYDMYSDQTRRQAIERALSSGEVRATSQVTLLNLPITNPDTDGLILYLPIRSQGGTVQSGTVQSSGVQSSGLLYAPLRISAVLPTTGLAGTGDNRLNLRVALGGQWLPGSRAVTDRATGNTEPGGFRRVETLNLAGQDWTLEFSAPPGFGSDVAANIPWLVLLAGTLVAFLAALATQAQVRARVRAEQVSRSLSVSQSRLERSRAEFEAVFRAMQDTAVFTDPGGQVLFANDALAGSFGLRPPELRGSPIADLHADPGLLPMLDAQQGPHLVTTPFRRRGGETFYGEMQRSRVVGESGETLGQLEVIRDVSERLQTDRALREGERRYQGVLEGLPQIVFLTDAAGRVSYLNRRWWEYVGSHPEAARSEAGRSKAGGSEAGPHDWSAEVLRAIHPDDRADFSRRWQDALGSGRDLETEYRLRSASGLYRTFTVRGRPVRTAQGRIQEWVGSSTDIDDQIYAELNSRLLADVGQAVNDRHSGLKDSAHEASSPEDSSPENSRTEPARPAGGNGQIHPQATGNRHAQNPRPAGDGSGLSALAGSLDETAVAEPRPTELPLPASLHDDEGLHRALNLMTARFADSAALWFSPELHVQFGHEAVSSSAQPIISGRARRIGLQELSQMDRLQEAVAEVMYRHEPSVFHGPRLHALGLSSAALYPLMQDDLPLGVLGLGFRQPLQDRDLDLGRELAQRLSSALGNRDLLARLHSASASLQDLNDSLEQRVAERTAQLSEANSELEAFSYSVSHDLRTPLRHILGFADLLRRESTEATPKAARYLKVIGDSAERMSKLIDDLLEFSRTSRAELRRSPVDLERLVQAARADLAPDQGERTVEWRVGPLPTVIGDAGLLRQVFDNLLSNALKYTRTRGAALIEVSARQQGREVWVSVRDNGVGFDPEYVGRLFGVFQRLHKNEEFEGTGIGLANVRRIVSRHGGRVWAESGWAKSGRTEPAHAGQTASGPPVRQGATFWVALPLEPLSLEKVKGKRRAVVGAAAPEERRPGLPAPESTGPEVSSSGALGSEASVPGHAAGTHPEPHEAQP